MTLEKVRSYCMKCKRLVDDYHKHKEYHTRRKEKFAKLREDVKDGKINEIPFG